MNTLIILEMANNHSGNLQHGKNIISAYSNICKEIDCFEFIFKFQYRNLDTFIRKDMQGRIDIPLVKRFTETKLNDNELLILSQTAKDFGFKTMVTPFDEESVDLAVSHEVDYMKIASCSFGDWPLLEKIASTNKHVIASCAGASITIIENVVSFFNNRDISFRLQHCVGEYPTKPSDMNIAQINYLQSLFPNLQIGFSSHEEPSTTNLAPLALASGATSFEKHVALETDSISKNNYSTSPDQFREWIASLLEARAILGQSKTRYQSSEKEALSLRQLQRGLFANKELKSGHVLTSADISIAFPPSENQLTANDLSKYSVITLEKALSHDQPILRDEVSIKNIRNDIFQIAKRIAKLIDESKITVPTFANLEISHHYGLDQFSTYGLSMITVVNREYCKKILILLEGQSHPEQYHKKKEETFHVLWGSGFLTVDSEETKLIPGSVLTILPGQKHFFSSINGLIIEEISSTHYLDDSFYTDSSITLNNNRKTILTHWRIANE